MTPYFRKKTQMITKFGKAAKPVQGRKNISGSYQRKPVGQFDFVLYVVESISDLIIFKTLFFE